MGMIVSQAGKLNFPLALTWFFGQNSKYAGNQFFLKERGIGIGVGSLICPMPNIPLPNQPISIYQNNMDEKLAYRMDRSAERILGNESLTAYLDDDAADVLIDWGLTCAQKIIQRTAGMDDAGAEEVMYQPMRATRRLMRAINRWIADSDDLSADEQSELLHKIIDQAVVIYGQAYSPPGQDQRDTFLSKFNVRNKDSATKITSLRQFVENIGQR